MNALWNNPICYITIQNKLPEKLQLLEEATPWGYWGSNPALSINQNESTSLHLKNNFWFSGVEGFVTYISQNGGKLRLGFSTLNVAKSGVTLMEGDQTKYTYTFRCKSGGAGESCLGGSDWQYGNCPKSSTQLCIVYTLADPGSFDVSVVIQNSINPFIVNDPNFYTSEIRCKLGSSAISYGDWNPWPPSEIAEQTFSLPFGVREDYGYQGSSAQVVYECIADDVANNNGCDAVWASIIYFNFSNTRSEFAPPSVVITCDKESGLFCSGLSYSVECSRLGSWWSEYDCMPSISGLKIRLTLFNQALPRTIGSVEEIEMTTAKSHISGINASTIILLEPSILYTPLSWAFGDINEYIGAGCDISNYKEKLKNFVETVQEDEDAVLMLYNDDTSPNTVFFASVKITNTYFPAGQWSSKLEGGPVVIHDKFQLQQDSKPKWYFKAAASSIANDAIKYNRKQQYFSDNQEKYIHSKLDGLLPSIKNNFSTLYGEWCKKCTDLLKSFSNPYQCKDLSSIQSLQGLGEESIPLYVRELMHPDGVPLQIVPYSIVHGVSRDLFSHDANGIYLTDMRLQSIRAAELWFDEQHIL